MYPKLNDTNDSNDEIIIYDDECHESVENQSLSYYKQHKNFKISLLNRNKPQGR